MRLKLFFITLIALFLNTFIFSQKKAKSSRIVYIKISDYKKKYNKKLTKKDSLSFKFIKNDTLIRIDNYKEPEGIGVQYEYKDETFLNQYKKIAFNHKKDSISKKTTMKYWKNPIKIFFSKSFNNKTKREFLKFTRFISENVDSLSISEVKKIEKSNYIIYNKGDFEYESRMHNYKNTDYYMYWNGKNQIYKCALKIDTSQNFNEKLLLYTLKNYFFRSLGHFKLSNEFKCKSFFANCFSNEKQLTTFDLALIKYHYSYGICKGTNLETFEEQHKKAKQIIKNKNSKMIFYHQM